MPKTSITYYCQKEMNIEGKIIPKGEAVLTVSLHKDIKQDDIARVFTGISNGLLKTEKPKDEETRGDAS